jgi:cell division protein FtsI/penicillin-binding protein 2
MRTPCIWIPKKVKDIAAAAAAAAPVTGLTEAEIVEKYNKAAESGTQIVVLARFLPGRLTDAQKQSLAAVEGLGVDNKMYTPIRDYPMGESVAHILGYLGYPKDAPEGSAKVGVSGLEAAYQEQLAGRGRQDRLYPGQMGPQCAHAVGEKNAGGRGPAAHHKAGPAAQGVRPR